MDLFRKISQKVFIVAEIGNNHNGSVATAKKLIDAAADAGVDAVKFQTFRGIDIVTPNVLSSEYPDWNVTEYKYWYEFLDSISLPLDKHKEVFDYAKDKALIVFSTSTSPEAVDFLEGLDVPIFKIASMDITNVQLLKKIASIGKPVIMSTGMAEEEEIRYAVRFFDLDRLILLHCVSDYPLVNSNANLRSIMWLQERFKCNVGFSDHSLGYELAIASVACGARVVEKHVTLDRNSRNKAEHHFSLEPDELKEFVVHIRQIESALGNKGITRSCGEQECRLKARRTLHVNKDIKAGSVLKSEDICVLRPCDGAPPGEFDFFVGREIKRNKKAWDSLTKEDI